MVAPAKSHQTQTRPESPKGIAESKAPPHGEFESVLKKIESPPDPPGKIEASRLPKDGEVAETEPNAQLQKPDSDLKETKINSRIKDKTDIVPGALACTSQLALVAVSSQVPTNLGQAGSTNSNETDSLTGVSNGFVLAETSTYTLSQAMGQTLPGTSAPQVTADKADFRVTIGHVTTAEDTSITGMNTDPEKATQAATVALTQLAAALSTIQTQPTENKLAIDSTLTTPSSNQPIGKDLVDLKSLIVESGVATQITIPLVTASQAVQNPALLPKSTLEATIPVDQTPVSEVANLSQSVKSATPASEPIRIGSTASTNTHAVPTLGESLKSSNTSSLEEITQTTQPQEATPPQTNSTASLSPILATQTPKANPRISPEGPSGSNNFTEFSAANMQSVGYSQSSGESGTGSQSQNQNPSGDGQLQNDPVPTPGLQSNPLLGPDPAATKSVQSSAKADQTSGVSSEMRQQVVNTANKHIQNLLINSVRNEVVVRMQPESLGTITIAIKRELDSVDANVSASDPQVREALRQGRPDIIQHFQQKGYGELKVNVTSDSFANSSSNQSQNFHQSSNPNHQHSTQSDNQKSFTTRQEAFKDRVEKSPSNFTNISTLRVDLTI